MSLSACKVVRPNTSLIAQVMAGAMILSLAIGCSTLLSLVLSMCAKEDNSLRKIKISVAEVASTAYLMDANYKVLASATFSGDNAAQVVFTIDARTGEKIGVYCGNNHAATVTVLAAQASYLRRCK